MGIALTIFDVNREDWWYEFLKIPTHVISTVFGGITNIIPTTEETPITQSTSGAAVGDIKSYLLRKLAGATSDDILYVGS